MAFDPKNYQFSDGGHHDQRVIFVHFTKIFLYSNIFFKS